MLVLSLDSSTSDLQIALIEDECVLNFLNIKNKSCLSTSICQGIQKILEESNKTLDDIDVFGICIGPGRFTPLRIGLSIIKALSLSLKKPWVGISSLDAKVYEFFSLEHKYLLSCMDAKSQMVFYAIYKKQQISYKKQTDDLLVRKSEIIQIIKNLDDFGFVSSDVEIEGLDKRYIPQSYGISCGKLAMLEFLKRKFIKEPSIKSCNYIKPSDAEFKLFGDITSKDK